MRVHAVCFSPVRSLCPNYACINLLSLLQEIRSICKTRNQLAGYWKAAAGVGACKGALDCLYSPPMLGGYNAIM
jgi:hypothetical protein